MRFSLTEQCATLVQDRKVLTQVFKHSNELHTSGSLLMPHKHIRFSLGCGRGSTRPRTTLAMTCPIMRPWIRLRSETIAEPTYLVGFQTTARVSLTHSDKWHRDQEWRSSSDGSSSPWNDSPPAMPAFELRSCWGNDLMRLGRQSLQMYVRDTSTDMAPLTTIQTRRRTDATQATQPLAQVMNTCG